jgi:hypothetical protein
MTMPNEIAAGNARWPFQFRFCGLRHQPRVPEIWTIAERMVKDT